MSNEDYNVTWSAAESTVQSYRSNFISSQSLLLAVGAIMNDVKTTYLLIVFILAILQIWFIWHPILMRTIKIVDFNRYRIGICFDSMGNFILENKSKKEKITQNSYVQNRKIRKIVNSSMKDNPHYHGNTKFKTIRSVRILLDIVMPVFFTSIWILILLSAS